MHSAKPEQKRATNLYFDAKLQDITTIQPYITKGCYPVNVQRKSEKTTYSIILMDEWPDSIGNAFHKAIAHATLLASILKELKAARMNQIPKPLLDLHARLKSQK